jgi:hypothetical protein
MREGILDENTRQLDLRPDVEKIRDVDQSTGLLTYHTGQFLMPVPKRARGDAADKVDIGATRAVADFRAGALDQHHRSAPVRVEQIFTA